MALKKVSNTTCVNIDKINGIFKKFYKSKEFDRIISVISLVLTLVLFNNYDMFFANLGNEKMQISIADNARKNCDYSTALEYYEKIIKQDDEYASYAALARLEIYNEMPDSEKHYNEIIECFSIALKSNYISVLKSCLKFVIEQSESVLKSDNKMSDLFKDENIALIKDLLNNINEIDKSVLDGLGLEFPVSENDVIWLFVKQGKVNSYYYHWDYVSTIVSEDPTLANLGESEKIEYVGTWQEPESESVFSAAMITYYKYYRYTKIIDEEKEEIAFDVLKNNDYNTEPIYLSQLDFDSETE